MDPNQLPYYHQHQPYDYYADLEPPSSMTVNSQQNGGTPDVPTAVQNLLLSTKSLQSSLSLWAQSRTTDAAVSDVYVQIGTAFNATIRAFSAYGIDLSDLHDIPTELRVVLEGCLAEDPSEEVLAVYMPQVRKVIWKLLKGLQARQEVWRRLNGGG